MQEFRIRAYFSDDAPPHSNQPRSYKKKIYTSQEEAEVALKEAREYYSRYRYIEEVVIEQRNVTKWKQQTERNTDEND
jgi:hypothetical protein